MEREPCFNLLALWRAGQQQRSENGQQQQQQAPPPAAAGGAAAAACASAVAEVHWQQAVRMAWAAVLRCAAADPRVGDEDLSRFIKARGIGLPRVVACRSLFLCFASSSFLLLASRFATASRHARCMSCCL